MSTKRIVDDYLEDILDSIADIREFTKDMTFEQFGFQPPIIYPTTYSYRHSNFLPKLPAYRHTRPGSGIQH